MIIYIVTDEGRVMSAFTSKDKADLYKSVMDDWRVKVQKVTLDPDVSKIHEMLKEEMHQWAISEATAKFPE